MQRVPLMFRSCSAKSEHGFRFWVGRRNTLTENRNTIGRCLQAENTAFVIVLIQRVSIPTAVSSWPSFNLPKRILACFCHLTPKQGFGNRGRVGVPIPGLPG